MSIGNIHNLTHTVATECGYNHISNHTTNATNSVALVAIAVSVDTARTIAFVVVGIVDMFNVAYGWHQ